MPDPSAERTIEANGRRYTLYFGNRAFRLFELELGKPLNRLNFLSIHEATLMVWAGLQRHHPDVTVEDVDTLIDEIGYGTVTELAEAAIYAAFPQAKAAAEGNDNRAQRRATARRVSPSSGPGTTP